VRPLNCPDLSPFDYHVFSPRQDISTERLFTTDIQKQEAVIAQLVSRTNIFFYVHTEAYVPWKKYLENKGDLWKNATLQTDILLHCFQTTHSRHFMTHLVKQTHTCI